GHMRLIDLVNALFSLPETADLELAVSRLMAHTLAHFAHEEAYLNSHSAAACNRHQDEHVRLFTELELICQRLVKNGGKELDSAMASFLRHWMVAHIMSHDKKDAIFMRKAS
ncbi:MAG: hypothetical protein EPN26_00545, partial [Rhodospirillales bacterium]